MSTPRTDPPLAADEVTMLRSFLDFYRATLRRQAEGLTREQLAIALAPSTMTLGGMLKHLALVEESWLVETFGGEQLGAPWADVDWEADPDWDWHSAADDDASSLLDLHARAAAEVDRRVDDALGGEGLDSLSVKHSRRRPDERFSLRWILVHLIEEYARHAGHADLIRESIDGATDL
ncbi:MAG: DinB family protein [Nocardioidaceae bacterium]